MILANLLQINPVSLTFLKRPYFCYLSRKGACFLMLQVPFRFYRAGPSNFVVRIFVYVHIIKVEMEKYRIKYDNKAN